MKFLGEGDSRRDVRRQLAEIARTLGPERCQSALAAFEKPEDAYGWYGCALARAYGARNEYMVAYRENGSQRHRIGQPIPTLPEFASEVFGLTAKQIRMTTQAFDSNCVRVSPDDVEPPVYIEGARDMLRDALAAEARKIQPGRLRKVVDAVVPDWLKDMLSSD